MTILDSIMNSTCNADVSYHPTIPRTVMLAAGRGFNVHSTAENDHLREGREGVMFMWSWKRMRERSSIYTLPVDFKLAEQPRRTMPRPPSVQAFMYLQRYVNIKASTPHPCALHDETVCSPGATCWTQSLGCRTVRSYLAGARRVVPPKLTVIAFKSLGCIK